MAGKIVQHESASFRLLEKKLLTFFKQYFRIQVLQGLLFTLVVNGLLFLLLILVNEGLRTGVEERKVLFYLFAFFSAACLIWMVLLPLVRAMRYRRYRRLLLSEKVLRKRFPEMEDTLVNLIELGGQADLHTSFDLVLASIDEKTQRLSPFRFHTALPYKRMIWPGVTLVFLSLVYFVMVSVLPDFMRSGYSRTIHYQVDYDADRALRIVLLNDSLRIGSGSDLIIRARVENAVRPDPVFIRMGETRQVMEEGAELTFEHHLRSVNGPVRFSLETGSYTTRVFEILVIPLPELSNMTVRIVPPPYTGLETKFLENSGDLVLAAGSQVSWQWQTRHVQRMELRFSGDTIWLDGSPFEVSKRFLRSQEYSYSLISDEISDHFVQQHSIEVIRDEFPAVESNQQSDSAYPSQVYFESAIMDDYGFSNMLFIVRDPLRMDTLYMEKADFEPERVYQRVYYGIDFKELGLEGDEFEYFFTVWDNDPFFGPKSASSQVFRMKLLSSAELFQQNRETGEKIGESMQEGQNLLNTMKEKLGDLMEDQLMDNQDEWEIQNQMDEISQMRTALEELIENIRQDNQEMNRSDQQVSERMRQIYEKQVQVEDLFEKLMDDELKQLFEEFEKLAEELTRKERIEQTENLKDHLENLERQLDINLELLRKLEISKEMLRISEEMDQLAQELRNLPDTSGAERMKERFNELEQMYDEQIEENQQLNRPDQLEDFKEERKEINEKLDQDKHDDEDELDGQDASREETADKMEDLSNKIEAQMGGGGEASMIDLETMRQLMRELNDYSFAQEELLKVLEGINARSTGFHQVGKRQNEMAAKFGVMRDSLVSLGYQEPMIAAMINEQVFHVETSLKNLDRSVQEGQAGQVRYEQQKIMEGVNELAVRLDELLNNIQAMQGEGQGKSKFKDSNPKESSEQLSEMKQLQQSMKSQLQEMIQQMKEGGKEGQSSQDLVRMLSEREQLRKALEEIRNNGRLGNESKEKVDDVIDMMEEVEKDIIYNRLGEHTIQREEWIQTRLLEAEQAEKERDQEETRVSEEFKGDKGSEDMPGWRELEEEVRKNRQSMGYPDVKLREYYRKKYQEYINKLNKSKDGRLLF